MSCPAKHSTQSLAVYRGADLRVVDGVNIGDPLTFATELDLDDVYELHPDARLRRLSVAAAANGSFVIGPDSELGRPGARLHLDACLTLMSTTGRAVEVLILVELDERDYVVDTRALPMAQLSPGMGYALVGIDSENARQKFAQLACVSFSRGTRITLPSGAQAPVEDLRVGDMVLTRDHGPQPLRWIGEATLRAIGEFAPVRIKAGTLHNQNDLLVSPDHRLFIYQRSDALGVGRRAVLVRARHLVNGETVVRESGGYIDYFQLLFDRHHIIFAEGIAAETFLVDTRTRAALPREIISRIDRALPERSTPRPLAYEVSEALLSRADAAALLKLASTR